MPLGMLFGNFLESFWSLLGALGPPLGDFWLTFAALGIAFETFVGFWACLVALGRICKVFGTFLKRFSTFLDNFDVFPFNFVVFLVFIQPVLSNVGECCGLGGWGGGGRGGLAHALQSFCVAPPGFYICL